MGAQALKSGPGTLGKPRFFGVPRGTQDSLPSALHDEGKCHSRTTAARSRNGLKHFQTFSDSF